jgi:murein DD-endopeptidase MepM/ murein hydrolase activator NlpD
MWPSDAVLTSGFGWRRNPLGRRFRFHSGIDLGGRRGDPIYAAAQGQVIKAQWSGGYGRYIEIDHGFGIVTLYAHNHRLLVEEGDVVRQGQKIALMGSTGRSTGPHLHFEVHLDGSAVDPMDYLRRARRPHAAPR